MICTRARHHAPKILIYFKGIIFLFFGGWHCPFWLRFSPKGRGNSVELLPTSKAVQSIHQFSHLVCFFFFFLLVRLSSTSTGCSNWYWAIDKDRAMAMDLLPGPYLNTIVNDNTSQQRDTWAKTVVLAFVRQTGRRRMSKEKMSPITTLIHKTMENLSVKIS